MNRELLNQGRQLSLNLPLGLLEKYHGSLIPIRNNIKMSFCTTVRYQTYMQNLSGVSWTINPNNYFFSHSLFFLCKDNLLFCVVLCVCLLFPLAFSYDYLFIYSSIFFLIFFLTPIFFLIKKKFKELITHIIEVGQEWTNLWKQKFLERNKMKKYSKNKT